MSVNSSRHRILILWSRLIPFVSHALRVIYTMSYRRLSQLPCSIDEDISLLEREARLGNYDRIHRTRVRFSKWHIYLKRENGYSWNCRGSPNSTNEHLTYSLSVTKTMYKSQRQIITCDRDDRNWNWATIRESKTSRIKVRIDRTQWTQ